MKVGIDASNLNGGAFYHLLEILSHGNPLNFGITQVTVWGSTEKLRLLPNRYWLNKSPQLLLDKSFLYKVYWKIFVLNQLAECCDVLYLPGANRSKVHPQISMCHNLLPFVPVEKKRYGWSIERLRLEILAYLQSRAFREADGIIFVSTFSKKSVEQYLNIQLPSVRVIYHGCHERFSNTQFWEREKEPIKILYVSSVDIYKHQDILAEAIIGLAQRGYPVQLILVGRVFSDKMFSRLKHVCEQWPNAKQVINYVGEVPYDRLHEFYEGSDLFVYPSTCETFGMTIIEAMSSGLPIVAAGCSSIPEVVGDAGIFFDVSVSGIQSALIPLIEDNLLRKQLSNKSIKRAKEFSWTQCADSTWSYIVQVYSQYKE